MISSGRGWVENALRPPRRLKIGCEWRAPPVRPRILRISGQKLLARVSAGQVPTSNHRLTQHCGAANQGTLLPESNALVSHSSAAVLHLHTASFSSQFPTSHLTPIIAAVALIVSPQQSCSGTTTAVIALCVQQAASCRSRPGGQQFQALNTGACQGLDPPTKMRCSSGFLTLSISVFVVIISTATARPHSIWDVDINNDPAPPPDKGPPLSAGALRDRSKLKYEVIGIVGAYVVWLIITFLLLFFVGKRLRHKIQTSNRTLSMEILKPAPLANQPKMTSVEPPLKSPGKMASLRSWASGKSHAHKPSNISVTSTIDEKILQADKAKNMDDMAKLYAVVMQHDEKRSQKSRNGEQTSPRSPNYPPQYNAPPTPRSIGLPPTPRSPYYRPDITGPASPRSPRYPAEFQHLRQSDSAAQYDASEPPLSPRLIHPLAPTPAEDPSSRAASQTSSRKKVSPLSLVNGEKRRPSNISVRGQPISQPLPSATLTEASIFTDEAETSPRIYNPGPAPPTPGQKSAVTVVQEDIGKKGPPPSLSFRSAAASNSSNNSSNSLPFRQFYNEALKSAPATKTTFVGVRESVLGVHPKTGMPQMPYSPYTPFTPMTPMTPRTLMTKKEMKKNRKKEGLKVLSEDDLVLSDEDLWQE